MAYEIIPMLTWVVFHLLFTTNFTRGPIGHCSPRVLLCKRDRNAKSQGACQCAIEKTLDFPWVQKAQG